MELHYSIGRQKFLFVKEYKISFCAENVLSLQHDSKWPEIKMKINTNPTTEVDSNRIDRRGCVFFCFV